MSMRTPAKILGIDKGCIKKGAIADITILDLNKNQIIDSNFLESNCTNSLYIGKKFSSIINSCMVQGVFKYKNGKIIEQ